MTYSKKLNQVFSLYNEKKYKEAYELVQEILEAEPTNIYAKRYESLIKHYLNDKSVVGKIATVKGKNLKCPHCESPISMSSLNGEQKIKIRQNNYNNLSIKCPYCHNQFTLQKKSFESAFGIKIGDKLSYNGKNFRVTGAVNYAGNWYEGVWYGYLNYLEWILLGDDNSYIYFSEGYFTDDGETKYEYEFSQKIIPDFSVDTSDINNWNIFIDGNKIKISEKNIVNAKSLYGENSKIFEVGEEIQLFEFSYKGEDYVLEKEKAGRQSEAGIYKTKTFSRKEVFELFGKEYKVNFNNFNFENGNYLPIFIIILFFLAGPIFTLISLFEIGFFIFIIFGLLIFIILTFKFENLRKSKLFYLFIVGPFLAFLVIPGIYGFFEIREEINLKDISEGKKYEISFEDESLKNKTQTSTRRYDYGGISTSYRENRGLKFSVISEEDKEIIEKIQKKENISPDVFKIFSQKIYKIN